MDIIGIGQPIKDFLMVVDKMQAENSFTALKDYSSQGGGKVSTALVAAARLGMKCAVMGTVGQDQKGRFVRDDFARHGIDTSHLIERREGETGYCVCLAERSTQNRRFFGIRPGAAQLKETELDLEFLKKGRILHLETPDAVSKAAAAFARKQGILVSMDGDPYEDEYEDLKEMEDMTDIFIGSEAYFRKRAGNGCIKDVLYEIAEKGCAVSAGTLGEKGSAAVIHGKYIEIPAYQGMEVVDTTGAGDVFHGAFLSAWRKGMDPVRCMRFASAVSAVKCAYIGGRSGILEWEEAIYFMDHGCIPDTKYLEERRKFYKNMVI